MKEQIEAMKQWCLANYENGADTMVECWGDEDYARLLSARRDPWKLLKDLASVYADRQADARNAFDVEEATGFDCDDPTGKNPFNHNLIR